MQPTRSLATILFVILIPLTAGFAGNLNTELIYASLYGNAAEVKILLEKGADINSKDDSGHTALMCAAKFGYTETVQVLLPKGADPNVKDVWNETALGWAAKNGHLTTVSHPKISFHYPHLLSQK